MLTTELNISDKPVTTLQLLGYSITFSANDEKVLAIISKLYPLASTQSKPTNIKIFLQPTIISPIKLAKQAKFSLNGHVLSGQNGASMLLANRQTMTAKIQLCSQMLRSPYLLRHQIINTVCYYLLSYRLVTPLHCCAFNLNHKTVVCLGNSGDGKSNIAMAAVEQGYALLCEDLAFISGKQNITLHSDCREIHLLPDSAGRFDQLNTLSLGTSHNGKGKYIVNVPYSLRVAKSKELFIVFLEPNYLEQQSQLRQNDNNNIPLFQTLFDPVDSGFDLHCLPRHQHIHRLSQQPSYIAKIGNNTTHFFDLLRTFVG